MKRRLFTLFAKFAPLALVDFPRQRRCYFVRDSGNGVVEIETVGHVELGDEIVLRRRKGQPTHYRVRGRVTPEHRGALTQARMLTLVTPRYAIVAFEG